MPDDSTETPLSPQVFHILLALADAPAHGYSIMQSVERETDGGIRLGPGTLYGAIRRLRREGLIEEINDGGDGSRRPYRLTASGGRALRREARRLAQLVESARARRLLPGRS
jgi:DNA-binding PadR family transcriptional regulator